MFPILIVITVPCIALLVGYAMGRVHERSVAAEAAERLRRLDPPRRTAGAPANLDAPPSEVGRPKWRSGSFKTQPPSQY